MNLRSSSLLLSASFFGLMLSGTPLYSQNQPGVFIAKYLKTEAMTIAGDCSFGTGTGDIYWNGFNLKVIATSFEASVSQKASTHKCGYAGVDLTANLTVQPSFRGTVSTDGTTFTPLTGGVPSFSPTMSYSTTQDQTSNSPLPIYSRPSITLYMEKGASTLPVTLCSNGLDKGPATGTLAASGCAPQTPTPTLRNLVSGAEANGVPYYAVDFYTHYDLVSFVDIYPASAAVIFHTVYQLVPPGAITTPDGSLTFNVISGSKDSSVQTIRLGNTGGQSYGFSTAISTKDGGNWLSIDKASGTVDPQQTVPINVRVDPSQLNLADSSGTIEFTPDNQTPAVTVNISVHATPGVDSLLLRGTWPVPGVLIHDTTPFATLVDYTVASPNIKFLVLRAENADDTSMFFESDQVAVSAGANTAYLSVQATGPFTNWKNINLRARFLGAQKNLLMQSDPPVSYPVTTDAIILSPPDYTYLEVAARFGAINFPYSYSLSGTKDGTVDLYYSLRTAAGWGPATPAFTGQAAPVGGTQRNVLAVGAVSTRGDVDRIRFWATLDPPGTQKITSNSVELPVLNLDLRDCVATRQGNNIHVDCNPFVNIPDTWTSSTQPLNLSCTAAFPSNPTTLTGTVNNAISKGTDGTTAVSVDIVPDLTIDNQKSTVALMPISVICTATLGILSREAYVSIRSESSVAADGTLSAAGLTGKNIQNPAQPRMPVTITTEDMNTLFAVAGGVYFFPFSEPPNKKARSAATAANGIMPINSVWIFDNPIAANAGFSGDFTFYYQVTDLPDDSNFNEANLQVLGYDPATGSAVLYPTIIDTVAHTGTFHADRLWSNYTLAVPGPFPLPNLRLPMLITLDGATTGFSFVNAGANNANLTATALAPALDPQTPLTGGLGGGQVLTGQLASSLNLPMPNTPDGWVQVSADQPQVAGTEFLTGAVASDAMAALRDRSSTQILTDIELNSLWSTEIHVANASNFANRVTVEVHDSTGAVTGSYRVALAPKGKLSGRVEEMVPAVTAPFTGYALVKGTNYVASAEVLVSRWEIAALPGQAVVPSNGATTLYGAHFEAGKGTAGSRLTLVNPTANNANLTIQTMGVSGAPLARPIVVPLAAGAQTQIAGATLGASTGLVTGSLVITSDTPGMVGDVSFVDGLNISRGRSSYPLDSAPGQLATFAQIVNGTGVFTGLAVQSTGAATPVAVRAFGPDGSALGSASLQLAANGRFSGLLGKLIPAAGQAGASGGYFTVEASQPVSATAMFGSQDLSVISTMPAIQLPGPGLGVIPGNPTATPAGDSLNGTPGQAAPPTTAPAISVSPNPISFGNVTVGTSSSVTITVKNTGTAALSITSIDGGGAPFATSGTPASYPASIAAGGQITFQATVNAASAGLLSGTLTIKSNDPAKGTLQIQMTGTAAAAATTVTIKVTPNPIAFGNVTVGTTSAPVTVTVQNTGSGTLSILSKIDAGGAPFSITGAPVLYPAKIAAGGQISFQVILTATTAGPQSGTLTIPSDDPVNKTVQISMTGTAAAAGAPSIKATPSTLAFGSVTVGKASSPVTVTVQNAGNAALVVSGIDAGGSPFATSGVPTLPATVATGVQFTFQVILTATAAGAQAGTLTITSNDTANSPLRIPMTGTATASGGGSTTPGLVAWWKFEEGGGPTIADSSGNGYDAKVEFGDVWTDPGTGKPAVGKVGGAVCMCNSGGSRIVGTSTGAPDFPAGAAPRSVVFWMKNTLNNDDRAMFSYGANNANTTGDGTSFNVYMKAGNPGTIAVSTGWNGLGSTSVSGAANVSDNGWHHVAVVFDGTTFTIYVDGALDRTGTLKVNTSVSAPFHIGAFVTGYGGNGGLIDELQLYSVALTKTQVQALYGGSPAGNGGGGGGATISVDKQSLTFASTTVGQSATQSFNVTNTGSTTLNVSAIGNNDPADFIVTPAAAFTVAPGAVQQVTVQFSPGSAGNKSANLTLSSNDTTHPTVTLTATGTAVAAGTTGDTTTGLVGWWKFDEASGTTILDSSGNNNTGTMASGASRVAGKFGSAISFDGTTGAINGGNAGNAFPFGSTARTMSAWVNISNPESYDAGVLHYGTPGGTAPANFHLYISGVGSKVGFGNGYGFGTISGTTSVATGTWHHITGVYEGAGTNMARIYVDGALQTSGTLSSVPGTLNGGNWRIGAFEGAAQGLRGTVDDVRIYNRALSATDVQALYGSTPAGGGGGGATAPTISLDKQTLSFANTTVGQSATQTFNVTNTGTAALNVTAIVNTDAADFTVTPAAAFTVVPGAVQQVTVQFKPASAGNKTATLTISSNDTANQFVTVAAVGTAVAPAPTGDTTTGLVGWWKFDEASGATILDSSGNNNTGTMAGGATRVAGKFGGAISFDGTNGAAINGSNPGNGFPFGSAPRTMSAWVNISNPESYDAGILHYGTPGQTGPATFHLYVFGVGAKVGVGNGSGYGIISGTTSVATSTWHHVVGVYEGAGTNMARIYVDGVLQTAATLSSAPGTLNGGNWRIGAFEMAPQGLRGMLDDVRIYNRALSATDVQALAAGQ